MVPVPTVSPTGCWVPKRPETCPQARKEKLGKEGSFSLSPSPLWLETIKTTGSEAGSSQVGQLSDDLSAFLSFAVGCLREPTRAAAALGGLSK